MSSAEFEKVFVVSKFSSCNPCFSFAGQKVPVNLSKVAGKLSSGIPSSQISFKEEKKNKVVPGNIPLLIFISEIYFMNVIHATLQIFEYSATLVL